MKSLIFKVSAAAIIAFAPLAAATGSDVPIFERVVSNIYSYKCTTAFCKFFVNVKNSPLDVPKKGLSIKHADHRLVRILTPASNRNDIKEFLLEVDVSIETNSKEITFEADNSVTPDCLTAYSVKVTGDFTSELAAALKGNKHIAIMEIATIDNDDARQRIENYIKESKSLGSLTLKNIRGEDIEGISNAIGQSTSLSDLFIEQVTSLVTNCDKFGDKWDKSQLELIQITGLKFGSLQDFRITIDSIAKLQQLNSLSLEELELNHMPAEKDSDLIAGTGDAIKSLIGTLGNNIDSLHINFSSIWPSVGDDDLVKNVVMQQWGAIAKAVHGKESLSDISIQWKVNIKGKEKEINMTISRDTDTKKVVVTFEGPIKYDQTKHETHFPIDDKWTFA